ncbi:MAG: ATP-binding protein [Bacteroidales bacterium]|nr:ATP-binding protein [Bacteroidales bacterium]
MAANKELLKKIIIDNQRIVNNISLIRRSITFEEKGNYVFVGIRQAGKSYLLYQRMQQLIAEGHSLEEMLYVSFDDERLNGMRADELDLLLQSHRMLFDCRPILFLDEIQNIDGWQYFARRLANEKYQVHITGSNAKMLSRDIATTLGGRYWVKEVYPYDFEEYLRAHNVELPRHWQLSSAQDDVARMFDDYFYFGGFPELTHVVAKRAWLTGIYNKIFFSDVVVRNGVRNEEALRMTIRRIAESVKQPIAYNRICNLIKSTGISTNPGGVMNFVRYLQDASMVFTVENYATKFVERETVKKHYFVDNGLLNLFLMDPDSSLLENIVAIALHKRYGEDLYYYNKNVEVDFYIPSEETGVQVCFGLNDEQTLRREADALVKLKKAFGLKQLLIISRNDELVMQYSGEEIKVMPVWKWLLNQEIAI